MDTMQSRQRAVNDVARKGDNELHVLLQSVVMCLSATEESLEQGWATPIAHAHCTPVIIIK